MSVEEQKKAFEYAALLLEKYQEVAKELPEGELKDPENLKQFIHAVSNVVPCRVYNELTGQELNHLQHNHTANHLVFDYSDKE